MPTLRCITISLQSQYDAATIPERVSLPSSADSPTVGSISSLDLATTPEDCTTVNVNIPSFSSSQFWISYSAAPPKRCNVDDDVCYFYFKLFTGGKCVLSWGVGEQENWSGKTMYALFSAGTDFEGRKVVEKRGLFFLRVEEMLGSGSFEVRVFRAKARKREVVKYDRFKELDNTQAGFDLTDIGRVKKGEKPRMYTYALIDPKDEPYVTFRYSIRTPRESLETDSDVSGSSLQLTYSHDVAPDPSLQPIFGHDASPSQNAFAARSINRHLSIPPRRKLVPITSNAEPTSPIKKLPSHSNSFVTGSADSAETQRRDWVVRTPSPMVSRLFDGPSTPPVDRRKTGSGRLLKSVVANALRRRGGGGVSVGQQWTREGGIEVT